MEDRGNGEAAPGKTPERLDWLDVARGIGIITVVASHLWTKGAVRDAFYSFHMPLFFMMSGVLSKPKPVGAFTVKQLGGQMRPYAAFLALLLLADAIIETMKGGRPIFYDWPTHLIPMLLGGTWLRGPFTIFWFVPCLMVARILYNGALSRWPDPRARPWWIVAPLVLALAYAAGWATQASPLGLLTVPMAFVLLWAGGVWRLVEWRRWMLLPLVLLAAAGLMSVFATLDMKAADYGWPILSVASGVATSLLLFRLTRHAAPYATWIGAIGRASLVIMYCHVALIHYLNPYLAKMWIFPIALFAPFALYHLMQVTPMRRLFL